MLKFTLFLALLGTALGQGAQEDSFSKKYAFGKVMHNCFGQDTYNVYARDLNQYILDCKKETYDMLKDGKEHDIQINEAPLASFMETLRSSSTGSQIYRAPAYVLSSQAANPFRQYHGHRQRRVALYSSEMMQKLSKKLKAKVGTFLCVLNRRNSIDVNKNLVVDDIKAEILKYTTKTDPVLLQGMSNVIDNCYEISKCVDDKESPLPIELQRILAYFECDKKGRFNLCMKYDLRNNLDQFELSGLPEFAGDDDAKVEKVLRVLQGSDGGTEPLDLLF